MSRGAKIAIAVAALALIFYLMLASPYNSMVTLDEKVVEARANMEATLQKRLQLVPGLLEAAGGHVQQEEEILKAVDQALRQVGSAINLEDKLTSNQGLSSALGSLMVVVERYPDLKADLNFRSLKDQLECTESRINVAQNRYTEAVMEYNSAIRRFPTILLARLLGYQPKEPFVAERGAPKAPK